MYNSNNDPTRITGSTDQYVALDSGRSNELVMGK